MTQEEGLVVSEDMRSVDAWLLDLGNVVIGIDFELAQADWAIAAGRDVDDLRQRFTFDDAYERHERGQIEGPEYFAALRSMLEVDLSDDQLAAGWNEIWTGPIQQVVDLLPAMARSRPLFALHEHERHPPHGLVVALRADSAAFRAHFSVLQHGVAQTRGRGFRRHRQRHRCAPGTDSVLRRHRAERGRRPRRGHAGGVGPFAD